MHEATLRWGEPESGRGPSMLLSVLNWNSCADTIECLQSLAHVLPEVGGRAVVRVIDNGSTLADYRRLETYCETARVTLTRQENNLGFAGGHNISIRQALAEAFDYVCLVNNDAIVAPGALRKMLEEMDRAPRCGAVSPIILGKADPSKVDYCGASHDWARLEVVKPDGLHCIENFGQEHADDFWVVGTFVLYRTQALAEVGALNEALFAYYEDNDIAVRLRRAGWTSRLAMDARVHHPVRTDPSIVRPAYFFYLMARNALYFWHTHTPPPHRRFIRYRIASRSIWTANHLAKRGEFDKARACLLGVHDGLRGRLGKPDLERRLPWRMRLFAWLSSYRLYTLLNGRS